MMTREHHRRRSPESSRRRRKERRDSREQLRNQQLALPAPPPEERNELIHLRSRASSPLSSSSSTSSSLLNISRPSRRFGLGAFFGGGGGGRKQHRVKKKRSRFLRFGNSSSSSVGSDLAYGNGYVERQRSREFSPPSSSAGKPRPRRDQTKTDEEILELGRQFAEIARQQNAEDLKAAGRSRPSTLVGAAAALSQFRRTNSGNSNRGVGSSKPRLDDSSDDSEWESASEDESSSSEFDSGLAYGSSGLSLPNTINQPIPRRSTPSSSRSPRPSQVSVYGPPLRRKSSVVDPNLFGPVNSLRGYVEAPCGFETVDRSTVVGSPRPYEPSITPSEATPDNRPLRLVYPAPTSDPKRFDVYNGPVVSSQQESSAPLRPAPVPIQHPRPIVQVPRRVLDSVETGSGYPEHVPSEKVPEDTVVAGLTGVAPEGLPLSSDRKDGRNKLEEKRNRDNERRPKRSDAGVQARKGEERKSHDNLPVVRNNPTEIPRETQSGNGLEVKRDWHYREMIVPELKRKSEEEGRRRDEHNDDNSDYDLTRNKRKSDPEDERKIVHEEARKEEHRDGDGANRSSVGSYEPVNGPEYPTREDPIDPFQFQVADDAFQTPPYTTPKRPLTPNVITVDREPNFASERLSRRDSYERELRDAREIYQTAEHATVPISGVAFAAATAAVLAEDRRGRNRSRGGDASSRNRSRRDESPKREKDAVQEDADRYYREAELARRIRDAEIRDAEPSVVGKWKQDQQPVIVDVVSPPEMDHAKKKSAYDAPDADVRIDNVLEHPNELSRFQTPDIKSLTKISVFTARDPSAERERPMLNVVRPTPVPTPIPEGQRRAEEPLPKLIKIDIPPPKVIPDIVAESRSEVVLAPLTAKSVSWGENQTKRYVVESPEREDDPYSGTKIVTPAKTPRSRTGKKSPWGLGFIAATLGGGNNRNTSSSTSGQTTVVEATEPRKASRNGDEPANRRASVTFKSTYDSPPIPGPKPLSLKGAQIPGSFEEDPVFTANIAAALEGSGFDPNIVIDDASFHKRDSPPGSNDFSVYQAPFVESVTDLATVDSPGTTASQGGREHGFVIGEVETPSDERDILTDKSRILSEPNRVEQRKQDKASERDGIEKAHATVDYSKAAELSRSVTEDDWDVLSNRFGQKERKKREKAARAQSLNDAPIDNKPRNEQDLQAEFIAEGEDSSPKKKSKKSKKAVVVQEDSRQPDIVESPKAVAPVDGFQNVQNANIVQIDISDRPNENNKGSKRDSEIYNSPSIPTPKPDGSGSSRKDSRRARRDSGGSFSRTVLPSELSTASSYGIIDTADSIIETEEEWDTPKKSKNKSKRDSGAYDLSPRSVPISETARDLTQRVDVTSLPESEQGTLREGKRSKRGSIDNGFAFPAVRGLEDWDPFNESKNKSTQDSSVHGSLSRVTLPVEDLYDSPKEMSESASDVRSKNTAAREEELDTPRKSKKSTRSSIPYEDRPSTPQSVAPPETSLGSSKRSKRDSYPDPLSMPSRSAPAFDAGTDDSRKKSKKKRSVPADLPEIENDLTEEGPTNKGKDRSEVLNYDTDSVVPNQARHDDGQPTGSQTRDDKADQAKAVSFAPSGADKKDRKGSKAEIGRKSSGNTGFFGRLKSSIGIVEEKKDTFLGNADILGAGVGSTGDAIMSQEPQSNTTNALLDGASQTVPFALQRRSTLPREAESIDPEIVLREIRPAIDPKYGDLLPLPPSRSGSPLSKLSDDFPPLPESRPETPENERHLREAPTHTRRRSTLETPTRPKTPSQSAIPIQFFRPGHRHTPSNGRSSPSVSPITATVEFGSESKNRSRPASWEASRDFKPLLLLQRALRGSIDLSSSPEGESSPSGPELRERGSPSSTHLILESPDRDHPFRDNIFSGPLSSPIGISAENPESSHAAEKAFQLHEGAFRQPSNEAPFHRNSRADGSHLTPLPEESDLKPAEDNSHSPFSSPTFLVAPNIRDQGDSAQGLLKDSPEDSIVSAEAAIPIMREPEITITSDDHGLGQAKEAVVSTKTPSEFLPVSDFFPGSKTPDSIDTFDTALSNAGDNGPLEPSGSLDNAQDDDIIQERRLSDVEELTAGSTNAEVIPSQDEILGDITYERTLPTGWVDPVPANVSTKDTPRAPEEDVDDNKSIETLALGSSILEAPEEQPSIEVQESDSDASTILQSTTTTSKKGKKKKRKNRKSQSTELSLGDPLIVTDAQNVGSDKLPVQLVGDVVPAHSSLIPTEQLPLVKDKSAIAEELTFSHEEPTMPESKALKVEVDTPTIELRAEAEAEAEAASDSVPIPLDMAAIEKPTPSEAEIAIRPEISNIELEAPSVKPDQSVAELETTATEPEISPAEPIVIPEPVLPHGEPSSVETKPSAGETRIEEPEISTVQKNILATEAELTAMESETPNAGPEPIAKSEPTIPESDPIAAGSETPTIQAEPIIIGVESASDQESALPNTKLEKLEQLETTLKFSPSTSEEEEQKDIERPLLENEQAEPTTSVEEPTKAAEELTQETSVESHRGLPVDIQTSGQDQPEATSLEPLDSQLDSPEEIPTTETFKKEENTTQTAVPELVDQVVYGQILAQDEEDQPLSESASLPIGQAEVQPPDIPVEGFVETPASPIQTEQQPNLFPVTDPVSEQVLQEEPIRPSGAHHSDEETSREILPPNQPVELILSDPPVNSHNDLESAVPVLGQDEQPQSASNPVLEETPSPNDPIKPEVSIVEGEQHNEQPTLDETDLQRSVDQESSGSALLEDTNLDEAPLQLDIPGGEDTRGREGPASTDPTEGPLSKPDWREASEGEQDKSVVPAQVVEEVSDLTPKPDDAQPRSLSNEMVNEEAREITQSLDEPGSEKGENKEMGQDVLEVVDASATLGLNAEPAPQPTPFEADVNEPQVVSDVPEKPSQDRENELDTSIVEEQSSVSQSIVKNAQEPVIEQAEPTADIVLSGPDSASKESQNKSEQSQVDTTDTIDAPALSGELESKKSEESGESEESKESVGEPTIVETDADSKPPSHSHEADEVDEVDVTAVTQVEGQAPEPESTSSKEDEDGEKPGPIQVETVTNDIPQETPEILDARGDVDKEVTSPTQLTIDRISDETQVAQAEEDTDVPSTIEQLETKEKPENIPADTEDTPASIILPEISTDTERSEKDEEKLQAAQVPGPLEQGPMETSEEPVGETPAPDTALNPDWTSINVSPPPDYLPETEVHSQEVSGSFGDASKAQQEPSQGQPIDPLDQLIQHIEARTQSNTLDSIRDGPDLKDFDVAAGTQEQAPHEDAEDSMEPQNSLLAEDAPKDEHDSVQTSSSDIVPAVQESANGNLPIEADAIQELSTQDDSQAIPVLPTQDTLPTEASPTAVLEPQDKIEQLSESMTNDSVLAASQVGEPTRAIPTSSQDDLSNPVTEHITLSDSQAGFNLLAEDKTQSTMEILPTIAEEGESEDQDAHDSAIVTVAPMNEPSTEAPSSDLVEIPSTISQDQTNLGEAASEAPVIAEPAESVSQPHQDDPQSPINKDKGKEKEISQVQEREPESPPLPTEPPTEQPQSLTLESSQTQDVMPLDSPLVQEIKTEPHLTEQDPPDVSDLPTLGTSKTATGTLDISPSLTKETEPRASDVTGTTVQSQDSEQEPGVQTDKAGDDMLIIRPEIAPSGEVTNVQDQEKTRQTNDLTENAMLEEEPVAEPIRDDESLENMVTPRPKKIKKGEKRGSQSILDDAASIPNQETTESAPSIPVAVDEAINSTKSTTVSDELSLPPSDRVDELTENAITTVQQDGSRPLTDNQSTLRNVKEITEPEPRSPESVSIEDKEGEESKQLTLLDDNLSEKIPEQTIKDSPMVLFTDEQSAIRVSAPMEALEEEIMDGPVSPRNNKKGNKAKEDNSHDENVSQVEPSQVSMDKIDNNEQTDIGGSAPQQSPEDADIVDPGPTESKDIEIKDVGRSDDVQSQEQNQAEFESAAQSGISEIAETENLTLESLKDDKVEQTAPTKKGKTNKKNKRASLQKDEPISQQEPAQLTSNTVASTSTIEQVNTEKLPVPENLVVQDTADLTPGQKDDGEKEPSTQRPELEAEILAEPEPDSTSQQLELPIEDTVPIEETHSTGLPEALVEPTGIEEALTVSTQDGRPSAEEDIPTVVPSEIVEEQVERGTLSESNIPLSDQTPTGNIAAAPTSDEPNAGDTVQSETVSQVPEEETNIVSSTLPQEEPISQRLVQPDEKREEIVDSIAFETPVEVVQLEEPPRSGEDLRPEESTQLKAIVPEEPVQIQDSPKYEPAQLGDPTATKLSNQEELSELEDLTQPDESEQSVSVPQDLLEVEGPGQQDSVQPDESTQRSEPELPVQAEEPTQLESSANPVQELPVTLDETEPTLTKKSEKSKKKKRVEQTEPEPASESTQLVETETQNELPTQSREQPVDQRAEQRAEQRASWGFFGGLTDSFKSLLSMQEAPTTSKDNENTEDFSEALTNPESKPEEKEGSQLEAEPTLKTVPSSEPIEQSQHLDSQLIVDDTSTITTDAVPDDVLPEVATGKKSKKKKKKASQVSQDSAPVPLESQAQPILPEESPIEERQEQLNALPKVEHTITPRGEEKFKEDLFQSSGSKMSKKERRKMKKLAALAAELFQPELDLTVEDEPVVLKTVSGPSEPPPEPVTSNSEVQNAPIINTTSTSPQGEGLQSPTIEVESSTQPIQEHAGDLAGKNGEELGAPMDQGHNLAPSPEPTLITSDMENITKDTHLDGTPAAIGEVVRDVQESKEALPDIPIENFEKGKEAPILNTPEPSTRIPNSDPQSQGLPDLEKQDVTIASTVPLKNEENLPTESNDTREPIKTPKIIATEEQELPANEQLDTELSTSNEPKPQSSPISRKSKKDKKKKRMSAQAGLETGSGTQTPVSQEPNTGHNSSDTITGEPTAQGLEKTMVNEGEWPESPNNPPQDETRRKASGTSTPLESIEDVLANASPDTVAKENAPRRLTLENISEVEGQGSKAKDVEEEIPPKPKDQDQNAENINISHPDENSVEVPGIAEPPSPVSERHPDKGPPSGTRQDVLDHVELPAPVTPPRTPSTVTAHMVNVDLSPAQLSSHIEHERPFDQSPQPGKRIRTYLSSGDPTISELLPTQLKFPRNTKSSGYDAHGLLPPVGPHIAGTSDNSVVSHGVTPVREIAVSYLESQLIPKAENFYGVEENNDGDKQTGTSGLLPALTPQREIAAPYFEAPPSEIQLHDNTLENTTREFLVNAPLVAMDGNIFTSPAESQLSQLGPGDVEEEKPPPAQPEARQPSLIQDTTTPARKIAAILMESHFHSSKKVKKMHEDADSTVPEIMPAAPSIGEATHLTKKYDSMKTPDTQDILDNRAVSGIPEPKLLEDKHPKVNASDQETRPSMGADEQMEPPFSNPKEIEPSRNPTAHGSASEEIESPVIGRGVQQNLPEPPNASRESPISREPPTIEIIKRLDDLDTSEHTGESLESAVERKIDGASLKSPSSRPLIQDYGTSGRNSPRALPPVREETGEELQNEGQNRVHGITNKTSIITEANRDSGFVTDSPHPMRRGSADELSLRDSGVNLRDWPEMTPQKLTVLEDESSAIHTPQPNEKRSKKLGLGNETPNLNTPISRSQDEVQITIEPRKTRMAKSQDVKSQDVGQRSVSETISRGSTPRTENQPRRSASNTSISRLRTPEPLPFRPESPGGRNFRSGSNTPPLALRRTGKRMSGDLRSLSSNLSNNNNASRENLHQTQQLQQTTIPVANEGRVRAKDMTDVYDGYGEGRIGSPRSPTRPQSIRRRQSIQVLELESRVEQLVAENRALADEKAHVEQNVTHQTASAITERDAEIESLKASLEWLHKEVNRLTEVNEGLHSANNVLALQHNEKYKRLESQHASAAKELENSRLAQDNYDRTIQEKDSEIQELRAQLEVTKEHVREMQRQILAHKPPDADFLRLKDEDHFDHRCQQLCQHVQQWVLRFSKFSDMRACRLTSEINDEKIIDRLDNAVLDGSDVDEYLSDRVRRRDIFMSMTVNMIWEFVFTRYLFGMDREHRQKLKSLEKLLMEVGPPHAVRQWRAVTLTLLSKRPAFGDQRNQDTEAVVQAVFQTLCMILPPPSNLEAQIQSQLRRVMREAVDLSIEMRTQRAEYMMLPPLQPEYDANGDLVRTVAFNAALMNERSGDSVSNDQYEVQRAIVRTVLFPLVVKKGDDNGVGDEEVVICPAQVLVAKPPRHATIRIVTPTSDTGGPLSRGATPSAAAPSTVSLQMQDAPLPMPTPPQEAEYLEGGI
ncbi:hypothetical protein F4814DRAFT_444228 [Daldinia grandis]|nr:hypothetical protein F4814DRAFT_444228 [Daldinia grandis]